jgi:4'-phosphopantetheinyl transferase
MNVYWMEQTLCDVPAMDDWLNEPEVACIKSMRIPKRRHDWRLGRWTGKRVTAKYFGLSDERYSLREIEIRSAPSGAPELFINNQHAGVSISLSHRNGRAMCALAENPVALGCDLEVIEPHSGAFVSDFFTLAEQLIVSEAGEHDLFSSLIWSAKESALKALGTGLQLDTRCVEVRFGHPPFQRGAWGWLQIRRSPAQMFAGWWQQSGDFVRTLVANPAPGLPILLQCQSQSERDALSVAATFG